MTSQPTAPHLLILAACASMLLSSVLVSPVAPGESLRVAGQVVPDVCMFRQTTGLPCPGCGLTRSVVAAVHADWAGSLTHHRMGLLILGYLVLQIAARLTWLGWASLRDRLALACRALDLALVPLLALLVVNWIPTLVGLLGST